MTTAERPALGRSASKPGSPLQRPIGGLTY